MGLFLLACCVGCVRITTLNHFLQKSKMNKKPSIWKYVLILAATGAVAAVGGKVSQCIVDSMHEATELPPMDPVQADALASKVLELKCADCHAQNATYSKVLNFFSLGLLRDHVEGAKRTFTLTPDSSVRSANVDYLKMDYVLRTRRMPPASYSAVHLGSRLTPTDVAILRNKYKESGAAARAFAPISPAAAPACELETARIYLGYLLYHDGRLSTNNQVSCASCHDLTKGGTDNLAKSEGVPGPDGLPQLGGVNAPSTFNAAGNIRQFWDGRAADLKEQAGGPPLNPVEMGFACVADWDIIAHKLSNDAGLVALFAYVFGDRGICSDTITEAIAAYEQTLVTPDSAFDRYLKGDDKALTDTQKAGMKAFVNLGCATCHSGPTLGGISFEYINTHNDLRALAAPADYQEGAFGLRDFTKKESDKDMFRVPNLRNVALTAPYFHTGTVNSLQEAVSIMIKTQNGANVGEGTVKEITRFLEAQTGKLYGKPANALKPGDVKLNPVAPQS